jgi:hypothetical protein
MRALLNRLLVWLRLKKPARPTPKGGGGPGEEK